MVRKITGTPGGRKLFNVQRIIVILKDLTTILRIMQIVRHLTTFLHLCVVNVGVRVAEGVNTLETSVATIIYNM